MGASGKRSKVGHDIPQVPADSMSLPHMVIFNEWMKLGKIEAFRSTRVGIMRYYSWAQSIDKQRTQNLSEENKTMDTFLTEELSNQA